MFKELEELIPPPGQFILVDPKLAVTVRSKSKDKIDTANKLDIFKDPATAKTVYTTYARCWNNAISLLGEARLLFQNKYYARAVAIGITAWEELGKSQLAADYYSGVISNQEYRQAFKNHSFKTSYLARTGIIDGSQGLKIGY